MSVLTNIYDARIIDYGDEDVIVHVMDKKGGKWRYLCECKTVQNAIDIVMLYNPSKFTVKIKKKEGVCDA